MMQTSIPKGSRPSRVARQAPPSDRPPFAVPSVAEISEIVPNGLTVVSTFAGAGGSSTGWQIAGYRVAWANEFHPPAADSYALNHPGTILDRRDIRKVTGAEIIEAIGGVPDVLDGSPPCQDFSMAGKRTKGWGQDRAHGDGTHQRSDDLFGQYTRLLGEIRPRAFVAENVKGLVAGAAKGQFKRIHAALAAEGYRVRAKILDAQWLGVPQRRKRVIIIGIRDDLDADPVFPDPLPYRYSMLDACPWLAGFDAFTDDSYDGGSHPLDEPVSTIATVPARGADGDSPRWQLRHWGAHNRQMVDESLDHQAPTITDHPSRTVLRRDTRGNAPVIDVDLDDPTMAITTQNQHHLRLVYDDHNFHRGHVDSIDDPASTIAAAGIRGVGMTQALLDDGVEQRRLSIEEVKRLCSFPDDYQLTGPYAHQWARLGNSVPPLMMAAVARALAPVLLRSSHDVANATTVAGVHATPTEPEPTEPDEPVTPPIDD